MRLLAGLLSAVGVLAAIGAEPAAAQPQIPATFFGSVAVGGAPAPDGAEVRGFVGGTDCTQSPPGERIAVRDGGVTAYAIEVVHESQRPGCGRAGLRVTFTVDGVEAVQDAAWEAGAVRLDLSTGSGTTIPLPTATNTPTVAETPGAGESAGQASPKPGTPPTDDITLPGTLGPGTTPQDAGAGAASVDPDDGGDGGNLGLVAAVAVAVLALAGVAGGVVLSRRKGGAARP